MPPPEQQMAQSPPPVAPVPATGTAPSRAGRTGSIPAAGGLDLNDLMPPLLGPNARRIAPGIQGYGGSRTLPDTCQRRETEWRVQLFGPEPAQGFAGLLRQLRAAVRMTQEELDLLRPRRAGRRPGTAAYGAAGPRRDSAGGRGVRGGQVVPAKGGIDTSAGGWCFGARVGSLATAGDPANG